MDNSAAKLIQLLPPVGRAVIYGAVSLIGLALTATQSAYGAISEPQPDWLIVAWVVYGVVGTGTGILAAGNVQTPPPEPDDADGINLMPALPEDGDQ